MRHRVIFQLNGYFFISQAKMTQFICQFLLLHQSTELFQWHLPSQGVCSRLIHLTSEEALHLWQLTAGTHIKPQMSLTVLWYYLQQQCLSSALQSSRIVSNFNKLYSVLLLFCKNKIKWSQLPLGGDWLYKRNHMLGMLLLCDSEKFLYTNA